MNFLKALFVSSLLLALSPLCYSADAALNKQRTLFQQAKKALQTNQTTQFAKLNKRLENYPLQPYLDYLYLQHRLNHVDSQTIANFLEQHQNTFYAKRLRSSWLNRLASTKKWSLFLEHYQEPQSTARQCLRLQALIATGAQEQAFTDIPALWLVPRSQNKACDPAFKLWQDKGLLTNDLLWQRVQLALRDNQFNLAKYLAKSLENAGEAKAWISRWQKIHSNPLSLLKQLPAKPPKNQIVSLTHDVAISRDIIKHGLQRLARKSTDKAFETWQRIEPAYSFSEQDKLTIQRYIANRAALSREDRTLEFFGDIPAEPWRVRAALWQQDWSAVQKAIYSLNSSEQQSPRWQYWLARSQTQLGDQQ
ncbi:MAG: transglycosylase, partial [Proteobacteria bacterium]|nr:transglycosylase [Pseudomonadota bacterium]